MDLDEWELIPDDGLLEIHDDGGENKLSRTCVKDSLKGVFKNYIDTPPVESTNISRLSNQLVPLSVDFQPNIDQELVKQVKIQNRLTPNIHIKSPSTLKVDQEADQDSVSQEVFFKKTDHRQMNETIIEKEKEDDADGVNMWKWSFSGIGGAICSFGVGVAAAICIIILANGQQQRKYLQFQVHADDKRIKDMVPQTSRLNEAMSAAKGIPLARAHITYGGYYEGF